VARICFTDFKTWKSKEHSITNEFQQTEKSYQHNARAHTHTHTHTHTRVCVCVSTIKLFYTWEIINIMGRTKHTHTQRHVQRHDQWCATLGSYDHRKTVENLKYINISLCFIEGSTLKSRKKLFIHFLFMLHLCTRKEILPINGD
jgi:hypothetical protein